MVLLALLFLWVGLCAAIEPGCLSLSGSQECQAFQGYQLDVWNGPVWLRNTTSVEEMDNRLGVYLEQQGQAVCGSNATRYVKTIVCAQMIQNSSVDCNPTLPSLCDDTLQQTCNLQPITTTTCIHGYDNDPYCGWTNDTEGCNYCQSKPNDPCCTTQHNPCPSSHQTTIIISAVLVSVFICLAILGCIWHWRRQRNNSNDDDNSTLYIPSSSTSTLVTQQQATLKDDKKEATSQTDLTYTLAKRHADDYCFYKAIYVNVPSQPYDILLNKGDIVHLHCYTNEDWGIGYNVSTGQQGSFPMICIHSLTLDQVWELVESHPVDQQKSLLKHRVYYFISSGADDEEEDDTMGPTSSMIHTPPSPDDDDHSPITPPPPTLIHRALGYNYSSKPWSASQLHYQPITPGHHL